MSDDTDPQPDGLWKPFTSAYNRYGVLFVQEVPRVPGESGENYCRRVANQYTLQAGVEYRNERLKQHYAEGKTKQDLALLYGLRMQNLRELLYELGLEDKPEPPKEITKEIRRSIIRMRKGGKSYEEIEKVTGIKYYRASELWREYKREQIYKDVIANRKRRLKEAKQKAESSNAKETT